MKRKRTLVVCLLAGLSLAGPAFAIFGLGDIVFDPSNFEEAIQQQALSRLHRLREPVATVAAQPGRIVVFASAKPGSGASTLAAQTAFSLRKSTGKRVLLADFDLLARDNVV